MARLSKIPRCEMRKIMDQKIRDLKKLGYTMGEVAEMLNVSKTTVFNALKAKQDEKVDTLPAIEVGNLEIKQ